MSALSDACLHHPPHIKALMQLAQPGRPIGTTPLHVFTMFFCLLLF